MGYEGITTKGGQKWESERSNYRLGPSRNTLILQDVML